MKKFLLLFCTIIAGISIATAQDVNKSDQGFIDVADFTGSSEGIYLSFYDILGYVADKEIYHPESKYELNEVNVVIITPKKKIKFNSKENTFVVLKKELAGQAVEIKVSKIGYKTLKTSVQLPAPKQMKNSVLNSTVEVYPECYVFLSSTTIDSPSGIRSGMISNGSMTLNYTITTE
ncbi:MAG: hypothetical protein J6L75_02680 [Alistipes sp.]|nr:hypothetical protein [Alistipes sp.]